MAFSMDEDIMVQIPYRSESEKAWKCQTVQLLAAKFLHSPGRIHSWIKCFKTDWFALRTKHFGGLTSSPEHLFHSQLSCSVRGTGQELVCRHWNIPASKSKGIDGSDQM